MSVISEVINGETTGDALIDAIDNAINPKIVDNKPEETKSDHEPLDWLIRINDFLEGVPSTWTTIFDNINDIVNGVPQAYIDALCRRLAWRVNIIIERQRQKLIKSLYEQNKFVKAIIDILTLAKKVITDPIGTISSFFEIIFFPFTYASQFIKNLVTEVPRLAKNLTEIMMSLPPQPLDPDINFDEFIENIEIGKIDMDSIADPQTLPPPEEMFPEPPKVWGKGVFNAVFDEGTSYKFSKDKTKQIKYSENVKFAQNAVLQEQLAIEGSIA